MDRPQSRIRYRVLDELGGDTLQGETETETTEPMTLGEFADFVLRAWPLLDVLEANFENDRRGALDFFWAKSDFYPDFDVLCQLRVIDAFPEQEEREAEEE